MMSHYLSYDATVSTGILHHQTHCQLHQQHCQPLVGNKRNITYSDKITQLNATIPPLHNMSHIQYNNVCDGLQTWLLICDIQTSEVEHSSNTLKKVHSCQTRCATTLQSPPHKE